MEFFEAALSHWPFVMVWLVLMLVGQVMKNVFTRERAYFKGRRQVIWWWSYKTLALHPVLTGALVGLLWSHPEEGVEGVGAVFYFAGSGGASVWAYELVKGFAKKRGVDIYIPGDSSRPRHNRKRPVSMAPPPHEPESEES